MTETITETAEQGPVAGPEIRELLERARDHPDMPLWLGYNDSAQQGFDPAPVEFNQLFPASSGLSAPQVPGRRPRC